MAAPREAQFEAKNNVFLLYKYYLFIVMNIIYLLSVAVRIRAQSRHLPLTPSRVVDFVINIIIIIMIMDNLWCPIS